jgi:D-xylose 1-dehydrogenase (NADP+, D-xylono-1,5-lactone-forming)
MLEVEQFGRCITDGENPLLSEADSFGNAKVIDEALKQIFKK